MDPLRFRKSKTFSHLLLNTGVFLRVAAVAGVDDAGFRSIFLSVFSSRDTFTSGIRITCQACPEVV